MKSVLSEADFAQQQAQLGWRVHEHQGVWWVQQFRSYCRPAFEYQRLAVGSAKPRRSRSLLGYSHQVLEAAEANRWHELMVLEGSAWDKFGLEALPASKRTRVRKSLRSCEIRRLGELDSVRDELRDINVSQAMRQTGKSGFGPPSSYYVSRFGEWIERQRREFGLPGREWWGAFADRRLVAYMVTYQVATTRTLPISRSHTDFLSLCPNDGLYFTVLSEARASGSCTRVIDGAAHHDSLNRFKEQFLLRATPVPYFSSNVALQRAVRLLFSIKSSLFEAFRFKTQRSSEVRGQPGVDRQCEGRQDR